MEKELFMLHIYYETSFEPESELKKASENDSESES